MIYKTSSDYWHKTHYKKLNSARKFKNDDILFVYGEGYNFYLRYTNDKDVGFFHSTLTQASYEPPFEWAFKRLAGVEPYEISD